MGNAVAADGFPNEIGPTTLRSSGANELIRLYGNGIPTPVDFQYVDAGAFEGDDIDGQPNVAHDYVFSYGFNLEGTATDQPRFKFSLESRWNNPAAEPLGFMEWHEIYTSIDGQTTVRMTTGAMDLNTHKYGMAWNNVDYFWIINLAEVKVFDLDADAGSLTVPYYYGTWSGQAIAPTKGGTGLDTSAVSGIPSIGQGSWIANSLTAGHLPLYAANDVVVDSSVHVLLTGEVGIVDSPAQGYALRIKQGASDSREILYLAADATVDALGAAHHVTFYMSRGSSTAGYSGRITSLFDTDANDGGRMTLVSFDASALPLNTLTVKRGYVGMGAAATDPGVQWYNGCVEVRYPSALWSVGARAQFFVLDSSTSQAADVGGRIDLGGWRAESSNRVFTYASIKGAAVGATGDDGYLAFAVRDPYGALTEWLRIDSSGGVKMPALAGSGDRYAVIDSTGKLKAGASV